MSAPPVQAVVAAGVLGTGALLGLGALEIPSAAGYAGIGPDFLPWLVSVLLILCGVALLREALVGGFRDMDEPEGADRGDWPAFAWVSAGLLCNAALITTLGFVLSCALCFVLAARGFRWAEGGKTWHLRALLSDTFTGLAIAAPVYWLFGKALAINLPGLTGTGWL